jgi:beta-1,4-mannosyl-glycoprotein beta-1,4-N-acetylglucosaminyltransferase
VNRVYDCFMFFNEFDLLKIRLEELWEAVDFFILVEGSHTHTGEPKPFYFQENRAAFEKYGAKLIARTADLPPHGKEPWFGWGREIVQRSAINGILSELGLHETDIVISSDVDEIPKVRAIEEYRQRTDICCLEERTYHYNLNCQLGSPTLDPKICRYSDAKRVGVADLRYSHQALPLFAIKDAGWHLSFMGGTEKIIEKMKAYAHYDIREPKMDFFVSRENVEASVKDHKSLFLRDDVKYVHTKDYSDLPKYIRENFQTFVQNGWIVDP